MSAGTPWSVKGIDSKAREVAKDLARRSGMTLGEWLNQVILEGDEPEADPRENRGRRPYVPQNDYQPETGEDYPSGGGRMKRTYTSSRHDEEFINRPRRSAPAFSSVAARERAARYEDDYDRYDRGGDERHPAERHSSGSEDLSRVARALESLGSRIETSETRSASAVRGVSQAVEGLLTRLERTEAGVTARTEHLAEKLESHADDVFTSRERLMRTEEDQAVLAERLEAAERLVDAQAERLEGLSGHLREERERVARLEAELRAPQQQENIRALEGALGKISNQLYETDVRNRENFKDVRSDMLGLSHRLTQMELRDPDAAAQSLIDKVVAQVSQRLDSAEAQTSTALKTLEQSFAALDSRLLRTEERGDVSDPESVQSLRRLADDLTRRIDEARVEIARSLEDTTHHNIEQALSGVHEQLAKVDQRSAKAIEQMGHNVLKVADNLNRRMTGVERQGHDAADRLNAEIRRVADSVEVRFARQDGQHSQALEHLSGEIARISERLSSRISESERRTAQVLDGVQAHLRQTHEHTHTELGERIRQSEARTAQILEEARARIEQRLSKAESQQLAERMTRSGPESDVLPSAFASRARYAPPPELVVEDVLDVVDDAEVDAELDAAAVTRFDFTPPVAETVEADTDADDLDLTGHLLKNVTGFGDERVDDGLQDARFKPDYDPFEDDLDAPAASVEAESFREDDEADPFADVALSRKTAPRLRHDRDPFADEADGDRAADIFDDEPLKGFGARRDEEAPQEAPVSVSTRDALAAARAAVRASLEDSDDRRPGLGGLKLGASRTRGAVSDKPVKTLKATESKGAQKSGLGETLKKAFKASSVAVALTAVGAGGYAVLRDEGHSGQAPIKPDAARKTDVAAPIAAAAITPPVEDRAALERQFQDAVQALTANDPVGIDKLKAVANQGYAPAQFRLGRIYDGEEGFSGITPDKTQARLWTQRAAEGGVSRAMHNLGLMYYAGDGGQPDRGQAATWFRRAAERGIVDSQYNLGIMYREGIGVTLNPTEAYKWLLIAEAGGDKEAAQAVADLKAELSAPQRRIAESQANGFQAVTDDAATLAAAPSTPQP
jgi:localization factor PodJL